MKPNSVNIKTFNKSPVCMFRLTCFCNPESLLGWNINHSQLQIRMEMHFMSPSPKYADSEDMICNIFILFYLWNSLQKINIQMQHTCTVKVVYRVPATGSRSPGILCQQCTMNNWHVARHWAASDGGRGGCGRLLLSRWRRPLRDE